ncbi:hypothetical protein FACS1894216_18660 [Synergistales bacterium]|nr:hypothetical protein FACS1894216_18660 [Synergistales bacterium]
MASVFFRGTNAVIQPGTILRAYVDKTTILSADLSAEITPDKSGFQGKTEVDQKLNEYLKEAEEKKN